MIDILDIFDKSGFKSVVDIANIAESQGAVNITAHCVDKSIDSEECGMMVSTWDLFDECFEDDRFGLCVLFVVFLLAWAGLSVFIMSEEEDFVDVHWWTDILSAAIDIIYDDLFKFKSLFSVTSHLLFWFSQYIFYQKLFRIWIKFNQINLFWYDFLLLKYFYDVLCVL